MSDDLNPFGWRQEKCKSCQGTGLKIAYRYEREDGGPVKSFGTHTILRFPVATDGPCEECTGKGRNWACGPTEIEIENWEEEQWLSGP